MQKHGSPQQQLNTVWQVPGSIAHSTAHSTAPESAHTKLQPTRVGCAQPSLLAQQKPFNCIHISAAAQHTPPIGGCNHKRKRSRHADVTPCTSSATRPRKRCSSCLSASSCCWRWRISCRAGSGTPSSLWIWTQTGPSYSEGTNSGRKPISSSIFVSDSTSPSALMLRCCSRCSAASCPRPTRDSPPRGGSLGSSQV